MIKRTIEENKHGQRTEQIEFDETLFNDRLHGDGKFIAKSLIADLNEPLRAKYMWYARYYNEKAKEASLEPIRVFKPEVPPGKALLTVTNKSPSPKK